MINKFFNRLTNLGLVQKNSGFAFTASAVVVAVLIGMVTIFIRNYVSVNTVSSVKHFSSSQAFWSSMSGIDYLLQTLEFDAGPTEDHFVFDVSSIDIMTYLPFLPDSTRLVTSTGTHGGHPRSLRLLMQPPTPWDNEYFNIDSTGNWAYDHSYECVTPGIEGGRFWGSSCADCPGEDYGFQQPVHGILDTTYLPLKDPLNPSLGHICYWLGRKEQNPKEMFFNTITDLSGISNIEVSLWIGAGMDVADVAKQSEHKNADEFYFEANDVIIEHWMALANNQPLEPLIDPSLGPLQTQYQQYTFNISNVLGSIDTLRLSFGGNMVLEEGFTGFAGVTMSYDLQWIIDISTLQEY